MKAVNLSVLATVCAVLSACGGGSDSGSGGGNVSADAEGRCTSDFVLSYNTIGHEASSLKFYLELKKSDEKIGRQAQALVNACDKFFPKHENVICKAEVIHKETTVNSNDRKPVCDEARKFVAAIYPTAKVAEPAASPENCSPKFASAFSGVASEIGFLRSQLDAKKAGSEVMSQTQAIESQIQTVVSLCKQFFQEHDNVTCKLEKADKALSENGIINSKMHTENCELVQKLSQELSQNSSNP